MTFEVIGEARLRKHSRGLCLGNGVGETQGGSADCPSRRLWIEREKGERRGQQSNPVVGHPF